MDCSGSKSIEYWREMGVLYDFFRFSLNFISLSFATLVHTIRNAARTSAVTRLGACKPSSSSLTPYDVHPSRHYAGISAQAEGRGPRTKGTSGTHRSMYIVQWIFLVRSTSLGVQAARLLVVYARLMFHALRRAARASNTASSQFSCLL